MKPIPAPLQTVYFNLAQQATADAPASVKVVGVKGKRYFKAEERHGATRISRHIGPVEDGSARAEAERLKAHAEAVKAARKLVSVLRNAGVPGPTPIMGRILEVIANARLFESGALVLVGTVAYACYAAPLGVFLPPDLMMTEDLDLSVVTLASKRIAKIDLLDVLRRADPTFQPIFNSGHTTDLPSKFRASNTMIVETITSRKRGESPVAVPEIGSSAVALAFQEYLVEEPERLVALHGAGVPILAPRPARYAVHKLMIAGERHDQFKRMKDLTQAQALFAAVPPDLIDEALEDACRRGRKWKEAIEKGRKLADL